MSNWVFWVDIILFIQEILYVFPTLTKLILFSYILLFTSGGKLQSLKYLMHELLYTICKYLYFMAQHTWHFKTLTKELNRFPVNENSKMNWMRNFARKKFCEYHKCCYSCNNYLRKKAFGSLCSESSALEVLFYHY